MTNNNGKRKRVLIATDGSKFSDQAVRTYCKLLSNESDIDVRIISVIEPPIPLATAPYGISAEYYVTADKTATEMAENAIKKAEELVIGTQGNRVGNEINLTTETIKDKAAKRAIVEQATEWGSDLIVVGSHGYGFWDRMLLGSVSSAVVNRAPCSVLVVRTENPE